MTLQNRYHKIRNKKRKKEWENKMKINIQEQMNEKLNYCLNCKVKPCSQKGCPLGNDIPAMIQNMKEQNVDKAYEILAQTTVLSGVCGRICPHQKQCQGSCVRGIKSNPVSIGEIEAYIFDKTIEKGNSLKNYYPKKQANGKKVAVVGGGPAGLTCSAFLAKEGFEVTIYEKYHYLGGLLIHGIPEFRLPKEIVEKVVHQILELGVKVEYGQELGKNITLKQLEEQYDAVFLSFGANKSSKMGIQGEELDGVFGGNELLEHGLHPNYQGKTVAVIGGGNVAMDCARTVKRLGAKEVKVIYRRAREQMPAEKKEIEEAMQEGIEFLYQYNVTQILGNEKVEELEIIQTELVEKEGESRLVPINVENSEKKIPMDFVIMALGSKPENFVKELGLELNKWGRIQTNENFETSHPNVYAGGDIAGTKSTVAWAARSGRDVAYKIKEVFTS